MKPRQPPQAWTAEDAVAWIFLLRATRTPDDFNFDSYIESDRHDADLMLERETQIAEGPNWSPRIYWHGELMTPLPAAPLTQEDISIWLRLAVRCVALQRRLVQVSDAQDRRDAALMLGSSPQKEA